MERTSPVASFADADLFTSFAAGTAADTAMMDQADVLAPGPEARPAAGTSRRPAACPVAAPPQSLLSRLPTVTWLLLAGAALVIVTSLIYYWRRRQTTSLSAKARDALHEEAIKALTAQVSVLEQQQEGVMQQQTILAQQHNTLAGQLRNVAAHSRSVEQGLGQALESWTATIQQLREEFELLVEEEEVEVDGDGEGQEAAAREAAAQESPAAAAGQPPIDE